MVIQPMNWQIFAVIMSKSADIAVYDVLTNIGGTRFVPALGIPLPDFIVDFMSEMSATGYVYDYGDITVFMEYPIDIFSAGSVGRNRGDSVG